MFSKKNWFQSVQTAIEKYHKVTEKYKFVEIFVVSVSKIFQLTSFADLFTGRAKKFHIICHQLRSSQLRCCNFLNYQGEPNHMVLIMNKVSINIVEINMRVADPNKCSFS